MGQYFTLVNATKHEFVVPPGGGKAREKLTNPVGMAALGYLQLEGPQDGTAFVGQNANPWECDPSEATENQRELWEDEDDPRGYKMEYLSRSIEASKQIAEANEYAGRWAGDEVYLMGDYTVSRYYRMTRATTVVEFSDGTTTELVGERRKSTDSSTVAEAGDSVKARHPETENRTEATVLEVKAPVMTNISDGLFEELEYFLGEEWVSENESRGAMTPDALITAD